MMWDGKKATSQRLFYTAMDRIKERTGDDPLKLFKKAVENAKPLLEVKTRRVGGANYQVPVEVPQNRRTSLAIRWILSNARSRPEKGMPEKLANELNDAANMRGGAIKKKRWTSTAWRKPTRLSRITGGNSSAVVRKDFYGTDRTTREDEKHRHHGSHRCR